MVFGRHLNKYYLKYAWMLVLGIASLILVDFFQLLTPRIYNLVVNALTYGTVNIDGAEVPFTMDILLTKVCAPMLIIIFVMLAGRFLWRVCFFGASIRVVTDMRSEMFDHCKDLSQQFYNVNKVGDLMSLFTNDLDTIEDCFGSGILMAADALCLGVMAVVKMVRMNPLLTLFSMLPMVFLFAISTVVGKSMRKKWDRRQAQFSKISDFSQESFSGIAVIKAFVREYLELAAFDRLNKDNENANVDFVKTSTLLRVFVTLFEESVIGVILGYGGYLVYVGTFNAGELIEFIGYFTSIVWPILAIAELVDMSSRGKASLGRISKLLDTPQDVVDAEGVEAPETIHGKIEFKDLTWRYPGANHDNLHNVSFKIEAGENIGIIGKTGSGKTTVCDLILRTYNVPDGTVFVDDIDINKIPIRTVREFAAYVPQDNFLFSDTIAENIAFASDSGDMALIENAARIAGVDDDINGFPLKYETVLGERGVTVSGGQKQRISIARAVMKDASILIMDDSVSAVDTDTERRILGELRELRKGKTTILIAHRVSTIEQMDKILYMDRGRVLGFGTHEELMETCPEFRKTVELQRLEDKTEQADSVHAAAEQGGGENA
ncbi:MAG: ABC transporter ATP-binding protein [Clostridia bacterium]|nr:ABC transporter ATP-binding protein [Clostridia bacterium]